MNKKNPMVYVMSDIHGDSERYDSIIGQIALSESDELYVLGDVIDRGPDGIDILLDMMSQGNVIPIIGNHEQVALDCMGTLMNLPQSEEEALELSEDIKDEMVAWVNLGGVPTIDAFRNLPPEKKFEVFNYLEYKMDTYKEIEVGGAYYVLCHEESYYDISDFEEAILITGHTPTDTRRIVKGEKHIRIDCGCGYDGQLGALCLNTGEEFYA
jgi:serine/threonine protein phosphatase 1